MPYSVWYLVVLDSCPITKPVKQSMGGLGIKIGQHIVPIDAGCVVPQDTKQPRNCGYRNENQKEFLCSEKMKHLVQGVSSIKIGQHIVPIDTGCVEIPKSTEQPRSCNIPEDLVFHILSWLPVDSLARFKCVNKSWHSLIESPEFVAKHLRNHVHSDCNHNVLVQSRDHTLSMVMYNKISDTFVAKDAGLPLKLRGSHIYIAMTGHPNGILCFLAYKEFPEIADIVIANLGTGEFIYDLPPSCISYDYECDVQTNGVGCSVDIETNDYKVVRMLEDYFPQCEYSPRSYRPRAEIYTSKSNCWSEISFIGGITTLKRDEQLRTISCFWNGVCYWPAREHYGDEGILSFDMESEVFKFFPLPDYYYWFGIIEYKGCLALISQSHPEEEHFDVWALDELLNGGSTLTKVLSLECHEQVENPSVFLNCNELLLQLSDKGKVIMMYNIHSEQGKDLPVNVGSYGLSLQVVMYKGSLVSIKK